MGSHCNLIAFISVICLIGSSTEIDIAIESRVQHIFSQPGQSVTIECIFNQPVDCVWYRKDAAIKMGERYTYLDDSAASTKSTNCSLRIVDIQLFDFGSWKCSSYADEIPNPPSLENFLQNDGSNSSNIKNGLHPVLLSSLLLISAKIILM